MNNKVEDNIYLLEQLVLAVMDQGKLVAAATDKEADLLEELQQIAVALHFTTQTLKHRLGFAAVQETDTHSTVVTPEQVKTVEYPSVNVPN